MSNTPYKIQEVQRELYGLENKKDFEQAQKVILSVIKLLDDSISENNLNLFQLFNDSDGKIRANASWFFEDKIIADRKATYKVHVENSINMDFKVYGVNKASKRVISWATALTPNFEDEPFNSKFNIGIDFIVPKSTDRVIIVLTNNYIIRTLELKGKLTATYQEILGKWLEIKDFSNKKLAHTALWESFDLQPLNKKFYAGISERFIILRQYLIKENILDEKHASMFANRLIGRVIFCWFLDKKGIINSKLEYFDPQGFSSDTEYYKTNLEKLFFGVLNTPIEEREYKDDITPFLNGGLFEARKNDLYKDNKLSFPKNYFSDLFDFLSAYNFTTDESTSQFQQVAIDPEMLGRIFENLLAEISEETGEQARKAKGAFYTPREIVDYMCKESLKEYLKTKIPEDTFRDQRLYQLIDAPDKDFQDQDHNWRRDWKPYKDTIISALDDLKVLDPACGSGAFPIGMLQLLVRVYERLEPRFDDYKAKLQIIEKNIYGVDIEPMAVEISRLRTWLSIVVDEESDSKKIKPLPNLEFKFVCANSLIDLDKNSTAGFIDDPELKDKIRDIRDSYFKTESLNKKKNLKEKYEKLVYSNQNRLEGFNESEKSRQLKTYRPFDNEAQADFFDPYFMFGINSFNIVFGNPPYISYYSRQAKSLNEKERSFYNENYDFLSGIKKKSINTVMLFLERGLKLLKKEGIEMYIIDMGFFEKVYKEIRQYLSHYNVQELIYDISDFENVASGQIIIKIKNQKTESFKCSIKKYFVFEKFIDKNIFTNDTINLNQENESLQEGFIRLEDVCNITCGLEYGALKDLFLSPKKINEKYYKVINGQNVPSKYKCTWEEKDGYVLFDKNFEKKITAEKKNISKTGKVVHFISGEKNKYLEKKIFIRQSAMSIISAIDENNLFALRSLFLCNLKKDSKYSLEMILGILNSDYIENYSLKNGVIRYGKGKQPQIRVAGLESIPIPKITKENNSIFNEIDKIVSDVKNDSNIEIAQKQINLLVNRLYLK